MSVSTSTFRQAKVSLTSVFVLSNLLFSATINAHSSRLAYRRGQRIENKVHTLIEQQQQQQQLLNEQNFFGVLNEEDRFLFSLSYSMSYLPSRDSSSQSSDPVILETSNSQFITSLAPTPTSSTDTPTTNTLNIGLTSSPTSSKLSPLQTSSSSSSPTSTPTFLTDNKLRPPSSVRKCVNQDHEDNASNTIDGSSSQITRQTIELAFKYTAEITASDDDVDDFLTAIENKLLDTVSSAVLKCDTAKDFNSRHSRMLFHPIAQRHLQVTQVDYSDQIVGSCHPVANVENTCHIVEARMTISTTGGDQDVEQVKLEALKVITYEFRSGGFTRVSEDGINPVNVVYEGLLYSEDENTFHINGSGGYGEKKKIDTKVFYAGIFPLMVTLIAAAVYQNNFYVKNRNYNMRKKKQDTKKSYCDDLDALDDRSGLTHYCVSSDSDTDQPRDNDIDEHNAHQTQLVMDDCDDEKNIREMFACHRERIQHGVDQKEYNVIAHTMWM